MSVNGVYERVFFSALGGSLELEGKALFSQKKRRLNSIPIAISHLVPWLLFCVVCGVLCFGVRYHHLWITILTMAAAITMVLWTVVQAAALVRYKKQGDDRAELGWWCVLALSMIAALALGIIMGDVNYATNTRPYFDYQDMNRYFDIDLTTTSSLALSDAGRVGFRNDTVLDLRKSMSLKNVDTYCVAPVVSKSSMDLAVVLDSYDFWAVGLGCCSVGVADFHCPGYQNPRAHDGLRLLNTEELPYFNRAVAQAAAAYSISVRRPLFFYWSEDANALLDSFHGEALRFFELCALVHFLWQGLCVCLAVLTFSKLPPPQIEGSLF